MRTFVLAVLAIVCSATVPAFAQTLSPGNPLSGLEQPRSFETMRASSSADDWRNGNGDARPIAPGGTLTLADLSGPGVIVHIWCTIAHDAPNYSRLLTLRMYWDGEKQPSVECPIGDFFGIGHGVDQSFMSLPIRVTSNGRARNCYWPMPFAKSAKITVTNESDKPCRAFYYYVDWQKHDNLPAGTPYFHAMYRQEHPCIMGRNYLIADIEGAGHFVGTVQSVYHVSSGWYGEGDDFFFIDGEKEPRLRGTGTEDYFCDAWGFRQQDGPFYGTPLWEGGRTGDRGTAYRFHIPDPVVFKRSLRVEIEHKGSQEFPDGTKSGFIERDDLMSSVGFWYQTEPHKPWPALPAGADRLPFKEVPLMVAHKMLGLAKHSDHRVEVQKVGGATDGQQLFFRPTSEKAWLEIPLTVGKEQTCDLILKLTNSWDYGIYNVLLDGQTVAKIDAFNPAVTPKAVRLGRHTLAPGPHAIRLECAGKSAASKGFYLGIDALVARYEVYSRDPKTDLRSIQAK